MNDESIAQIIIPSPTWQKFDYYLPKGGNIADYQPGMRVLVPFGKRKIVGLIAQLTQQAQSTNYELKHIITALDNHAIIPNDLLILYQWASNYYHYPIGEVAFNGIPKRIRQGETIQQTDNQHYQLTTLGRDKLSAPLKNATKQRALLHYLANTQSKKMLTELKSEGFTAQQINKLVDKNWIEIQCIDTHEQQHNIYTNNPNLPLTTQQQNAVDNINACKQFRTFVLDGVTGSGKTEVYLRCIAHVLEQGKQALVLVPEISLTPQTIKRFQTRFAVSIATLHSNLSGQQKEKAWMRISQGEVRIVIGTRSAIFAPLAQLGIIILDEEHDSSFKQQSGFRYSARDLAVVRAHINKIPVVLGSATPAFETLHNAMQKRYHYLSLPSRVGQASLPTIQLIDVKKKPLINGISEDVFQQMQQHLKLGNQVLLFLNRRGYAPALICHHCGWVASCHACDARLTLHFKPTELRCHHCGLINRPPKICPSCQQSTLMPVGLGTERIEQTITERFPNYKIGRIDRDSMSKKGSLHNMLLAIEKNEVNIIIGTQMIAKGHHFPNLTLVVIIDTDSALFSVDFRAIERMAQTIMQVAGRAGREQKQGNVLIQTHHPQHEFLQLLLNKGYQAFAKAALAERQAAQLPPFSYFALFRAEALESEHAQYFLQQVKQQIDSELKQTPAPIQFIGPFPAPMARKAGRYRSQLLLQSTQRTALQQLLEPLANQLTQLDNPNKVRWSLDVDPLEML